MVQTKYKENSIINLNKDSSNEYNKKNFNKNTIENLLCLFIILCPMFDILSFITRNTWHSIISASTFIRPIIPVFVGMYIFIKADKKEKKLLIILAISYILYAIIHLAIMKSLIMGCSYGNVISELQYVFNYTFLIIYFIIYTYTFALKSKNESEIKHNLSKLQNSIVIMNFIYIISIYFSILIGKSSPTYTETGVGYKGFIESGNSLSAILILSTFITLYVIKDNFKMIKLYFQSKENTKFELKENLDFQLTEKTKFDFNNANEKDNGAIKQNIFKTRYKKNAIMFVIAILTYILTSIYLIKLIGTRTGLLGTIIVLFVFILADVIINKNKKIAVMGFTIICIIVLFVAMFGSNTIKRRKEVNLSQYTIIDEKTGEIGTMTGDMLRIKNKILDNNLEEGYMSEAQKQSVIDLYNYTQKHNIAGNNTRKQQLMYNIFLVKNQRNIITILFGNGFKTNFREMVMENELASMILNFGIIGFILYIGPFATVLIYSIYVAIKEKRIDFEYFILQCALGLSFVLSWMTGYVFFSTSCMIVIVVIATMLICKTYRAKGEIEWRKQLEEE